MDLYIPRAFKNGQGFGDVAGGVSKVRVSGEDSVMSASRVGGAIGLAVR